MFRSAGWWVASLLVALSVAHPLAQSQAINGTIEGTITDQSGASLPGLVCPKNKKKTLLEASRIAIGNPVSVPAGLYAKETLEKRGLFEKVKPKLVFAENVRQVLDYVFRN